MSGPERRGLTLHVLDTTVGRPGAGVALTVHRITADGAVALATATTDADGRSDGPVVTGEAWSPGVYEVVFALGAYFGDRGDTGFLDEVPVRFTVGPDDVHVHLALLATPWSYHLPGQLTWPDDVVTIDAVNALTPEAFAASFGAVYEDTPALALVAAASGPFSDRDALVAAFVDAATTLDGDAVLALLRAHPMLGSPPRASPPSWRRAPPWWARRSPTSWPTPSRAPTCTTGPR